MTMNIFIGTEPSQYVASRVLVSSIVGHLGDRKVKFHFSWTTNSGWHYAVHSHIKLKHGTNFSTFRWMVPEIACQQNLSDRALYLDADQIVLSNISELYDWPMSDEHSVAVVKNARGYFGKKTPKPGHAQSSVMLMNLKNCGWSYPKLAKKVIKGTLAQESFVKTGKIAKHSYAALMQLAWMQESSICELPPQWNDFNAMEHDTKLLHWSCVRDQPYRNPKHPTSNLFRRELKKALERGHLSKERLMSEISVGHVHSVYTNV